MQVEAGAQVIITQLFYDVEKFIKFTKDCRALGIECPIIPGGFCDICCLGEGYFEASGCCMAATIRHQRGIYVRLRRAVSCGAVHAGAVKY